jgi:3-oxoacyl-[acyl-carrier protein] reductase
MADILERHSRLDILVNNAGVIFSEPFVNIMNPAGMMHDYRRFRDSLTVNLDSVFIVSSAAVEHMVMRRTKGVIVNISSISACGNEGQTAYSAAKAGVNAMTVTWSKELGRWGIRCNAVAPGFIGTESTRSALNESILKHIQANTPLRRLGEASEVAQAVAAIIENDFINGVVLDVNGGLTI